MLFAQDDINSNLTDAVSSAQAGATGATNPTDAQTPVTPNPESNVPDYLVGADNHQVGNTGSSIFDPTTWGDRLDNGFKFSVSALTRAATSTLNSVVEVGKLVGVTDDSNKADTSEWLHGMDDDLGKYYDQNKDAVNTIGDLGAAFVPGLAGMKVLNWAQKGIELATEGRAGLNLAAHFGSLPTKQAFYAEQAAKEAANNLNPFSIINGNLLKSIGSGYAQSALEFAAFNTADAVTMQDSPLFSDEDASDIAYNSMTFGGMIGAGIFGTGLAIRTISQVKKAGNEVDAALNAYRTVHTEPQVGTPAAEKLAIHLGNIDMLPEVDAANPLAPQQTRALLATREAEVTNGRMASVKLSGGDNELGNLLYDVVSGADVNDTAQKMTALRATSRAGITTRAERELGEGNASVSYLKLLGDDAGTIIQGAPVLGMPDMMDSEEAVLGKARSYGHKQSQTDWSVADHIADPTRIESRYITAQETSHFDIKKPIGVTDIPFLERAYQEMEADNKISSVTLSDGTVLGKADLMQHIASTKGTEALKVLTDSALAGSSDAAALTTDQVAKMVNVAPEYLKGTMTLNEPATNFFAMQTAQKAFTKQQVAAGNWRATKGLIKTYLKPSYAKLVYPSELLDGLGELGEETPEEADGMLVSGMAAIRQGQILYQATADNVVGNYLATKATGLSLSDFMKLPGSVLASANRSGVGGGLISSMNGNYKTLGSWAQYTGSLVYSGIQKLRNQASDLFATSGHQILRAGSDDGTEFWKVYQQIRQTPEKYSPVPDAETGKITLVNQKVLAYQAEVQEAQNAVNEAQKNFDAATRSNKSPKLLKAAQAYLEKVTADVPVFEDPSAPTHIPINTEGMNQFVKDWHSSNAEHLTQQTNLRASQGIASKDLRDVFYMPPVDVRDYPHFAFVRDISPTSTGHLSTIHAATAADLEALAEKVPTEQGLQVIYKRDNEAWHKAMGDYEYDLGINENYVDSALKKTGISGSFFPVTDAKLLWNQMMKWRGNQDSNLFREMIAHKYNTEVSELQRQGNLYERAASSKVGYTPTGKIPEATNNPFFGYVDTMLGIERGNKTPIWSAINRLAETSMSSLANKVADAWKDVITPADLDKVNSVLDSIGVNTFKDAGTYALANHTAPKAVLSNFIRRANSILTFTMLTSDPLNAINNGLGHTVMYGPEMQDLLKTLYATQDPSVISDVESATHLIVPGTTDKVLSPVKIAAQAYSDWWKNVIGKEDGGTMEARYTKMGLLPSFTQIFRDMVDPLSLTGNESEVEIQSKLASSLDAAQKLLGKATDGAIKWSGNQLVEKMNRFVSARSAEIVAEKAVQHGVLDKELVPSILNTFVNRVEGNRLAAQRPLLFRGPVGQALGLFQSYQFNMLQQLFRHIGDGNIKSTATLLGLQGSIYGMAGLPAFNAINNHLVGNAAGNVSHQDIYSKTYDTAGQELGDWLTYGFSSNMLLNPNFKMNLYSRGDINPRQVTVIPTQLSDVPVVGAATKFFGAMYDTLNNMQNGANKWTAFLQGVEHSGISRPLAGFAQVMEASANRENKVYSTDSRGDMVMQNDLFTAMSAARLTGAKPLDEARAMDAVYRTQVYSQNKEKLLNTLGAAIKESVAGGNVPSAEDIGGFAAKYAATGGDQLHFSQWFNRQVVEANQSKVNLMIQNANNPLSRYMQRIMGGYELSDFNNEAKSPEVPVQQTPTGDNGS